MEEGQDPVTFLLLPRRLYCWPLDSIRKMAADASNSDRARLALRTFGIAGC